MKNYTTIWYILHFPVTAMHRTIFQYILPQHASGPWLPFLLGVYLLNHFAQNCSPIAYKEFRIKIQFRVHLIIIDGICRRNLPIGIIYYSIYESLIQRCERDGIPIFFLITMRFFPNMPGTTYNHVVVI